VLLEKRSHRSFPALAPVLRGGETSTPAPRTIACTSSSARRRRRRARHVPAERFRVGTRKGKGADPRSPTSAREGLGGRNGEGRAESPRVWSDHPPTGSPEARSRADHLVEDLDPGAIPVLPARLCRRSWRRKSDRATPRDGASGIGPGRAWAAMGSDSRVRRK